MRRVLVENRPAEAEADAPSAHEGAAGGNADGAPGLGRESGHQHEWGAFDYSNPNKLAFVPDAKKGDVCGKCLKKKAAPPFTPDLVSIELPGLAGGIKVSALNLNASGGSAVIDRAQPVPNLAASWPAGAVLVYSSSTFPKLNFRAQILVERWAYNEVDFTWATTKPPRGLGDQVEAYNWHEPNPKTAHKAQPKQS